MVFIGLQVHEGLGSHGNTLSVAQNERIVIVCPTSLTSLAHELRRLEYLHQHYFILCFHRTHQTCNLNAVSARLHNPALPVVDVVIHRRHYCVHHRHCIRRRFRLYPYPEILEADDGGQVHQHVCVVVCKCHYQHCHRLSDHCSADACGATVEITEEAESVVDRCIRFWCRVSILQCRMFGLQGTAH